MNTLLIRFKNRLTAEQNKGMELVQVAILIAIAVVIGVLFKDKISSFVKDVFGTLNAKKFTSL